jgi:hypothetical protein
VPATAIGLGLQNSANALASGRDNVSKLASQLATLETQRPGLVNTALSNLQNANAQSAGLDQNQKLLGLTAARQFEDLPGTSPFTGLRTTTQVGIDQARAKIRQAGAKLTIEEQKAAADVARTQIAMLKYQKAPQLTPLEKQKFSGTAYTIAATAFKGDPGHKAADGSSDPLPPLLYSDAMDEMLKAGIPPAIALQALNRYYPKGFQGRPATMPGGLGIKFTVPDAPAANG